MSRAIEKIKIINLFNGNYQFPMTFGTLVVKADGVTPYCDEDAEENVLEGVKLNGTDLNITGKKISLSLSMAEKSTPNPGCAATYQLMINGTAVGDNIDIPTSSGGAGIDSITLDTVTAADKAAGGKFENDSSYQIGDPYIDFELSDSTHLYINVKTLVSTYTAGNGLVLSGGEFSIDTSVVALKLDITSAINDIMPLIYAGL
jgi:hypothetical protein